MRIDEAITHEKELAKEIYVEAMLRHANPDDGKLDSCIESGKYHEQLAGWLEDYKHIKQWKSDVMDDFCRYDASSFEELVANARNKAIDDFTKKIIRYVDCGHLCSPTEIRWSDLAVVEMAKKLAEKLKAGDGE